MVSDVFIVSCLEGCGCVYGILLCGVDVEVLVVRSMLYLFLEFDFF